MSGAVVVQLDPPIHFLVPEKDDYGLALFLIDYHMEEHLYFVLAMEKTGELWTLDSTKIRACNNPTIGRNLPRSNLTDSSY